MKWISVKYEMPPPNTYVLVFKKRPGQMGMDVDKTVFHEGRSQFAGRFWFARDNHKELTTYWAYLPEPPEENSNVR